MDTHSNTKEHSNGDAPSPYSEKKRLQSESREENASFIDTFAALEDLVRFQKPKFANMKAVFLAEAALTRKALLVSISLTLLASLLAFTIWLLINAFVVSLIVQASSSIALGVGVLIVINLLLFIFALFQLKSAFKNISLTKSLSMLSSDEKEERSKQVVHS
uniref:hypothetical protein n=1 Tax=Ningiella ruwaisensis TaxID=2364274 RepID=UPI0010A06066|nr:hypothetical protein [Ningiella ruwaisensis]